MRSSADSRTIPYGDIETVTLDIGNTLVSMDFDWIADEFRSRGIQCDAELLRRAEAAARPDFRPEPGIDDERVAQRVFEGYLRGILLRLEAMGVHYSTSMRELIRDLTLAMKEAGGTRRLWSSILPGVPEALAAMRALGLRLIVVSNSDGTAEEIVSDLRLRGHLDAVVDSYRVGFEKPDPRIFRHALELAGSPPNRTLHVGDQYAADVVGARSVGIHAILLDPFGDWGDVDCVTLPDLPSVQRRLDAAHRT